MPDKLTTEPVTSNSITLTSEGKSILIVDDNEVLRVQLSRAFKRRGYHPHTARDYDEAASVARELRPDLAVIDLRMPGKSGLDLLIELKRISNSTRVVVLTGFGSISTAVDAMRLGAANYVSKPADADDILAAFARANAPVGVLLPDPHDAPSLARAEWEHIHRILTDCGGNVSEAARRLGIHRRSLQRKLKKRAP